MKPTFVYYLLLAFSFLWKLEVAAQKHLIFLPVGNLPWSETIAASSVNRSGQLHAIADNGTIYQVDTLGKITKQLAIRELIGASSLDAWPTLKLLTFSEPLQQAYWIDRLLGSTQPLELPISYYYAAMSSATTDGVWAYESQELALHHITPMGIVDVKIPLRATPIAQLMTNNNPFIETRHDKIYLAFNQQGVAVCNIYGSYLYWINLPKLQSISLSHQWLYIATDTDLLQYDTSNQHQLISTSTLPKGAWQAWHIYKNYAFGVQARAIYTFQLIEGE